MVKPSCDSSFSHQVFSVEEMEDTAPVGHIGFCCLHLKYNSMNLMQCLGYLYPFWCIVCPMLPSAFIHCLLCAIKTLIYLSQSATCQEIAQHFLFMSVYVCVFVFLSLFCIYNYSPIEPNDQDRIKVQTSPFFSRHHFFPDTSLPFGFKKLSPSSFFIFSFCLLRRAV